MKRLPATFFIIIFFNLSVIFNINAQEKRIDSLAQLLLKDKQGTNRVIHLCLLSREHRMIGQYEAGMSFGKQALQLSNQLKYERGKASV